MHEFVFLKYLKSVAFLPFAKGKKEKTCILAMGFMTQPAWLVWGAQTFV